MAEMSRLLPAGRPQPPTHLSQESQEFWNEMVGEYAFDAAGLRVLKR